MGTYLYLNAPDTVIDAIAEAPAGTAAAVKSLGLKFYAEVRDNGTIAEHSSVDDRYDEAIDAVHPAAQRVRALLECEAFGKFQGFDLATDFGLNPCCDSFDPREHRELALAMLRQQRRSWGRRSVFFLGSRTDKARCVTEQRRVCWNAIAAIGRGDVTSIGWS